MGGIGGLLATLAASIVCLIGGFNKDTDAESYIPWVFVFGAVIMIAATVILFFFVKEPDSRLKILSEERQANDEKARLKAAKEASKVEKARLKAIKLSKGERKSLIFMLIGLFFLFCGANAVQTFFALFASEILNKNVGQATTMLFMFVVASAISAVPAGYLGKKLGRKKTILIGLTAFLAAFLAYLAVQLITGKGIALVWVALIVGGAANMLITVNTLPLVLEIGGVEKIGTFTGYYYTATFSAQIATPIIYGTVRMLSGTYMSLFVYCPICFIISFLSIMLVRHGESIPEDILKKAQQEDL